MKLTPQLYLSFSGQCEEAFRFYEQHLGARIDGLFRFAGSPMAGHAPPDWGEKVMHATIAIGDTVIAGADAPSSQYERPQGFQILLGLDEPAAAERIFHALAEGGRVIMPLQETFWAVRFGALVDRFGVPWGINCEQPPSPAASTAEGAAQ
jgi:PhnB protein